MQISANHSTRNLSRPVSLPACDIPELPESEPGKPKHSLKETFQKYRLLGHFVAGLPSVGLHKLKHRLVDSRKVASKVKEMSDEQLQSLTTKQLSALADDLMHRGILPSEKRATYDQQFARVIHAHGDRAADVDPILLGTSRSEQARERLDRLEGDAEKALRDATPGDWTGFQEYVDVATDTKIRSGSKVEPLINGQVAFPEMFKAIDEAKTSVNYTTYLFDPDHTGWEMAQHLAAAAERGCTVRLLIDQTGSLESIISPEGKKMRAFLEEHGVDLQIRETDTRHITHRKILVADGETGFIGGMNCGDHYSTFWHDIHSKVTGPAVQDLQNLFVSQWQSVVGPMAAGGPNLFPELAATGDHQARVVGHDGHQDRNMKLAYLRAIDTSQESIYIANPYMADPEVFHHLESAARDRHVDVHVILPQGCNQKDSKLAEHGHYAEMLEAGIHLHEYTGRPMAHDKVASFDHRQITIGSSNLDRLSLELDDESNIWVDDQKLAEMLESSLRDDIQHSVEVTEYHPEFKERLANRLGLCLKAWEFPVLR